MADYSIAAVTRRAVYTGSAGTGPYAFTFACLATSDIAVYKDTTKLTETSDYTVTLSASTGTGSITLGSAANSDNTITLVGARDLARTTDFVTAGSLTASALNTDFDSLVIFAQQLSEENSRNLKAPVTEGISGTTDMTIPPKATRASKILEFDSDGNPAVSLTATGLSTLAGISGNITTVAGIAANVTTVAGISANVTTVAGIASNVTSVAAKASLITSDFVADLNTLATSAIVTDLDILANADIVADLAILATSDVVADLNTLATSDIVTDINVLATSDIVSDLNTLATSDIVSDLNTLATSAIVTDLSILATSDIVSDINVLATSDIVSDLNTLATSDFVSDLNTLASSTVVANIATVATNVAGVNSFAARYRVAGSDPGSDNDAGDLVFNTSSNILKVYNGSSFDDVTGSTLAGLSDTNITSPADGSLLLYDTGTSKYIDNVISGDATLADTGVLTLAANSVDSDQYVDGSIDTIHIADGQITTAKVADDAITLAKISENVVTKDSNGIMVNATQPAFSVVPASDQDNTTGNGTEVTVAFGTEVFDKNADFASNTFTAPVTGSYFLSASVTVHDHTTSNTTGRMYISTSNRAYMYEFDPAENISGAGVGSFSVTVLADMDAGDVAVVRFVMFDSSLTVDIQTSGTFFQGHLVG